MYKEARINFIMECVKSLDVNTDTINFEIKGQCNREKPFIGIYNTADLGWSAYGSVISSKIPTILMNWERLTYNTIFDIIGHEAQHIKQILSGVMVWQDPDIYWYNKTYENYSYFDLPWEIDAWSHTLANSNKIKKNALKYSKRELCNKLNILEDHSEYDNEFFNSLKIGSRRKK